MVVAQLEIPLVARYDAVCVHNDKKGGSSLTRRAFLAKNKKTIDIMKKSFLVDEKGFYGEFGGAYVPEILYATVEKLRGISADYRVGGVQEGVYAIVARLCGSPFPTLLCQAHE